MLKLYHIQLVQNEVKLCGEFKKGDLLYDSSKKKYCIFLEYGKNKEGKKSKTLSKILMEETIFVSTTISLYKAYDKVIKFN